MKTELQNLPNLARFLVLVWLSTVTPRLSTLAQGTAFTYQGRLADGLNAASGTYELQFTIYDTPGGGTVVAGPITNSALTVSNGLFTVALDFGAGVFNGAARWLEIAVRSNGASAFTPLTPRQPLTATPYALYALTPAGPQGPQGVKGDTGLTGAAGLTGPAGAQGIQGVAGSTGATGPQGPIGLTGATGAAGTNGVNGATGPAGAQGVKGDPGIQGAQGPIGLTGLTGSQGAPGSVGPPGPQGLIGLTGATGSTGSSGPAGPVGATGAAGPSGPEGLNWRGAWSAFASYLIDDAVAEGGASWLAKADNRGAAPFEGSANWDLLARKGDLGATGPQGLVGAMGNTGPPGSTGATGSQGPAGATGPQGPQGIAGPAGTSGAFSLAGTNAVYSGGNVGVGTTTPATLLEIREATAAGPSLRLTGLGGFGSKVGIDLATYQPGAYGVAARIEAIDNNWSAGIDFQTKQPGLEENALASRLFIQNDGKVGIGTTGPGTKLDVQGVVTATGFSGSAGTPLLFGTTDTQPLEFKVNGFRALRLEPNGTSTPNLIGGASDNLVGAGSVGVTIGGGSFNTAAGEYSVVGGGLHNTSADGSTVSGGDYNIAGGVKSTVGGGSHNNALSAYSTVSGGYENTSGPYATVPGGHLNSAVGAFSFAAGRRAKANHEGAFVWGDSQDANFASTANNQFLIRAAGYVGINTPNPATALDVNGTVTATGFSGTAGTTLTFGTTDEQPLEFKVNNQRGLRLEPTAFMDTVNVIGGSARNSVRAGVAGATIGGGGAADYFGGAYTNSVEADFSTVSGGRQNTIQSNAYSATIGGGENNTIQNDANRAAIGGGGGNTIQAGANLTTIGGGYNNTIQSNANYATIGGGNYNTIQIGSGYATIGGGYNNTIQSNANYATIGGGEGNLTVGEYATVGGGYGNTASNNSATVSGGRVNVSSGDAATVPGGRENLAAGAISFAAGFRAKANHIGAFVWADASIAADIASTAANSVTMRASGGYRLFSNSGTTAGVSLAPGGTAWEVISDRNVKKDLAPVDQRTILEKLAALSITQWHYQWESSDVTPHIGPMAQDFKAAFYPGTDDKTITTQEADGVALAAIQGLNEKLEVRSQKSEVSIRELQAENAELKLRLEKLEQLMNRQDGGGR